MNNSENFNEMMKLIKQFPIKPFEIVQQKTVWTTTNILLKNEHN